jgi:hypothetical protein
MDIQFTSTCGYSFGIIKIQSNNINASLLPYMDILTNLTTIEDSDHERTFCGFIQNDLE